ncbi:MAG: SGNH/GDSL hydrolase family protein [Candidatus Delongbacteria bacterium]|nr:SGNH/GDSL hydrolase family protein [Candidatus Delongbacteria bacterium]
MIPISRDLSASDTHSPDVTPLVRIVVIGSSTSTGAGAGSPDKNWVNRYQTYLHDINPSYQVYNLAKKGNSTYKIQPDGSFPPNNRPMPDSGYNITSALKYNPHAIIINLPSNDATANIPISEQLKNYDNVLSIAHDHHIPVWITTPQPRNLPDSQRVLQKTMSDSTLARYHPYAIDLWSILADPEGRIKSKFDCGDGTHLNDIGHEIILFQVIRAGIIDRIISDRSKCANPDNRSSDR